MKSQEHFLMNDGLAEKRHFQLRQDDLQIS